MYRSGINVKNPGRAGYKSMVGRFCGRAKERFWELDFARGICVVLMVFDHCMYCMWGILPFINEVLGTAFLSGAEEVGRAYWNWEFRQTARFFVITAFFMLCGISCTLTRGNFRRFIPLALVAGGITCVTRLIDSFGMEGTTILFGVIHMLAAGILLYALLDNAAVAVGDMLGQGKISRFFREALRYLPGLVGIGMLIWLFNGYAHFSFENGYLDIVSDFTGAATTEENLFLSIFLSIKAAPSNHYFEYGAYTSDYFPILPWAAVVLMGGIVGRLVYHSSAKYAFAPLGGAWNSGVCFLGRHAAVIYIAHMIVIPALFALCALISSLF